MLSLEALRSCVAVVSLPLAFVSVAVHSAENDPLDFSLGELIAQEVITVAKKRQEIGDVAAAIYVVSSEDIARTGATTLPDALRLVPGVQVAAISNNRWAVSVRGFNGRFANKLLVMVDGRTVYSPLFSGTLWEALDIPLEEIDRIEVIRGPGASVWGANAVNGVINIITKWARATQGTAFAITTGMPDAIRAYARAGQTIEGGHYRLSYQGRKRTASVTTGGTDGHDRWETNRLGLRLERYLDGLGEFSMNASLFSNRSEDQWAVPDLTQWQGDLTRHFWQQDSGASLSVQLGGVDAQRHEWALQGAIEYNDTTVGPFISERRWSADVDWQYRLAHGQHDVILGAGLRRHDQTVEGSGYYSVNRESQTFGLVSAFVHDEITLSESLSVALGLKFEHHTWTGNEWQPNARMSWRFAPRHTLWASISEASRTPARVERDVGYNLQALPGNMALLQIEPATSIKAERMRAYELGLRGQPTDRLHYDVTAFSMRYRNMRSLGERSLKVVGAWPSVAMPLTFGSHVRVNGAEASLEWQPAPHWRARLSYTRLFTSQPTDDDPLLFYVARVPTRQFSAHATWKPASGHILDVILRHVGGLKYEEEFNGEVLSVDAYTELDLQYAYRVNSSMSLAIAGRNLLDSRHSEFGRLYLPSELRETERSISLTATWSID